MPATPTETPTLRIGARVLLLDQHDHVLLIHAKDPDKPDHHEKAGLLGHRWWSESELAACTDKLLPSNLPALLADVLAGELRQPVFLHD
jgi:hypothetical protein